MGNMISRKFLFTAVLSVVMFAGNTAFASSNDLLRMDVKKSSSDNTIDVTFFTTGNPTNTVVTRKSENTYVVLLPNVAGNQSVVPSLGGVKDLVSNVNVKNVDDGIGGYTKITFNTTKPIKIQTNTQKTVPLTKAQQDYKNLIAQNSKYDPNKKMENFKQTKSTPANTAKANTTPIKQQTETKNTTPKTTSATTQNTNKIAIKPVEIKVPQVKKEETKPTTPKASESKPEVKENIKTAQKSEQTAVKPTFDLANPPAESKSIKNTNKKQTDKKIKTKTINKSLPVFPVAGLLSALGILLLGVLMNIISKAVKNNTKLKEYLENYTPESKQSNSTDYNEILKKDNLNWQEKYKLYSEVKENENSDNSKASYVANISGTNGTVIPDDMQAKVSQMEHALAKTPSMTPPTTKNKGIQSEDDVISRQMSGLHLKTFAKNVSLKQTSRHNIPSAKQSLTTAPLKEGKFVNLENSELTMSQRNIGGHGYSISDLVRTGRRFLSKKQVSEELSQKQDEYIISSLEDYLKIVDLEENKVERNATEEITNLIPKRSRTDMMLSTSPMAKSKPFKNNNIETSDFSGISVTSRYDIDNDKSIYMVESDGISALIGKIGENITVLKKFDKVINKPLQVRLDYGSVYIVKVGGFKCLVDVAEEKMGTLLEI